MIEVRCGHSGELVEAGGVRKLEFEFAAIALGGCALRLAGEPLGIDVAEMPVLAAGTALFAIIAVVPTLAAVGAIYGLAADAGALRALLHGLESELDGFLAPRSRRSARLIVHVLDYRKP